MLTGRRKEPVPTGVHDLRAPLYGQDKAAERDEARDAGPHLSLATEATRKDGHVLFRALRFVLGLEASGLHAVSADVHVAPAAGVIFAGVEKQPAAIGFLACAQQAHFAGEHEADARDG